MKKLIAIALLIISLAMYAYADKGPLTVDSFGVRVQGFAPNGKDSVALTINKVTVDMRDEITWSAYTPTACSYRAMSTVTRVGLKQTLPANTRTTMNVHPKSMFLNFTGCTSGELQRQ